MACSIREATGTCKHFQCPYPTLSGYNCVELIGSFCEIGEGCEGLKANCPYAWRNNDWKSRRNVQRALVDKYPELRRM